MQAAQSHAQATVATTITYDNVTSTSGAFNPFITYGQQAQFQGAIVGNGTAVPGSCPFMWMNQTQTISALPQISQATTNQALQYGFVSFCTPILTSHYNEVPGAASEAYG